jgi:hypothetical protein
MILTGAYGSSSKTACPSVTCSRTKAIQASLGQNRDLRGERPATRRLNHGTARLISELGHRTSENSAAVPITTTVRQHFLVLKCCSVYFSGFSLGVFILGRYVSPTLSDELV